jgi:hypothetical protein
VGPKEKEFSKPFSIGQKLIIVLEIVMKIRKKTIKIPGGRLGYLEQMMLLALCPILHEFPIKIQIHPEFYLNFEFR